MTFRSLHTAQHRTLSLRRLLPCAAAALALSLPLASHALGDAWDVEQSSMRSAVEVVQQAPTSEIRLSNATRGPLTRAEVREATRMARAAGLMSGTGELGDTPELLQRREDFNALQTEVLLAEYQAQVVRVEAEQQAAALAAQQAASAPAGNAQADTAQADIVLLQAPGETAAGEPVLAEVQVHPGMTVGELMAYLGEAAEEGTVVVTLVPEEDVEED